jgi:hypothetical protein
MASVPQMGGKSIAAMLQPISGVKEVITFGHFLQADP